MSRTIMHVDMDAYFASVEQQSNPLLRNKPIAVIGAEKRTVVTTASYQARTFGVKTGMSVGKARRCCPHLIFVKGTLAKYTDTCMRLIAIFKHYTPLVEVCSIDEAFLDISGSLSLFHTPEKIASSIKQEIRTSLGLTCSIGTAPNKLLAKLASGLRKPDGLVTITPEDVPSLLEHLPVNEVWGIGPYLERALASLGIETCGQLGRTSRSILKKHFGIRGEYLHWLGRGIDNSPVIPLEEEPLPQSIGHSTTLPSDVSQLKVLKAVLLKLSGMVGRRLRKHALTGKTITLCVRYADFTTFTRQQTLRASIDQSSVIYQTVLRILTTITLKQAVRLLGVSISNLSPKTVQLPLFDDHHRQETVTAVMDEINDRFGEDTLTWATILPPSEHSCVITRNWRPKGNHRTTIEGMITNPY